MEKVQSKRGGPTHTGKSHEKIHFCEPFPYCKDTRKCFPKFSLRPVAVLLDCSELELGRNLGQRKVWEFVCDDDGDDFGNENN